MRGGGKPEGEFALILDQAVAAELETGERRELFFN